MKKQWNKDIHDRLKDFPKKAPEGLLDDIKSEMLRRGMTSVPVSNQSRPHFLPMLRNIAAIAAVLLLLIGLSHEWTKYPNQPVKETRTMPSSDTGQSTTTEIRHPEMVLPTPIPTSVTPLKSKQARTSFPDTLTVEKQHAPQDTAVTEVPEKEQASQQVQPNIRKEPVHACPSDQLTYNPRRKGSSYSTGIYYSGVIAQGNLDFLQSGDYDYVMADEALPSGFPNQLHEFMKEDVKHHLPVKLGLSVQYAFHEKWSLHSGLVYSYLASDISKSNRRESYQTTQKLHYIGIPLQIGYQLAKGKHFRSYLAAGGQVEKLVSGKATTDHSVNNQHQSTTTQRISDKKLLFSALASIGAEYMLGKDLSLYAEPGIHYYFKNGNELKTHYNEQPLNFNISIGFRFHWNK